MTILIARLTASLITYGIVAVCGAIGIWGALGNQKYLFNYIQIINSSDVVSADTVNGETISQKTRSNNTSNKSEMPQTGEANSNEDVARTVTLGLALILAGLGLGYKRRH